MKRTTISRRDVVIGAAALSACGPASTAPAAPAARDEPRFAAIEQRLGGRVGVAAWNTGNDEWLVRRADERFTMCSTFKWLLAALALRSDDATPGFLQEHLAFRAADLLGYAPTAREHVARGWMSVEECCQAAVVVSDNTAANLLLARLQGPQGFTQFIRAAGDDVTRLDRTEPELNENLPDDPRDTTSPRAMTQLLYHFLLRDGPLTARSRDALAGWLIDSKTGLERLRAGLPGEWRVGDKTGTSTATHNATNDVAIVWPKNRDGTERAPFLISCYMSDSTADAAARNAAHAEVASILVDAWG